MITSKNFRCPCCDTVGNYENVDAFRIKPSGMYMCKTCGMVTYCDKYKTEEEIKAYYKKDYRGAPQVSNLQTGERKLHYHNFFLQPIFEEWKKSGLNEPVIGEIGSAMGMFLSWIKGHFPKADILGTELTESFRKVAYFEYGIDLKEDFDYTKKYDLITSYHVLEHQLDPDVMLKKYAECLADGGIFYLSAPIWFRDCYNVAVGGFDLEYYWAPDHINAWSEKHLEHVIAKAGLEVIFKDNAVYGNTYILKKSNKEVVAPEWHPEENKKFIETAFKQWIAIQENQTALAIELNKNCPAAWMNHYELNRAELNKNLNELNGFLETAFKSCPNSADIGIFVADVLSRYDRYEEALSYFEKSLSKRPNNATIIMGMSNCYRQMALKENDLAKKSELIKKSMDALSFVRSSSMDMKDKAISWLFYDMSLLDISQLKNEQV